VLHRIIGRDLITFGRGGTGQLENLVVLPVEAFETINDDTTFHLDPPKQIFAYFYEGTNLGNNIYETRELLRRTSGHPSDHDIAAYVQEVAAEHATRIRRDWRHLNRHGYTLLGELLANALAAGNKTGSCVALAAN